MQFYWLVLGILGVWQITHLLQAEDGPWGSLRHLRTLLVRFGLANAVTCFYCLSLWVALPVAIWIGESWSEKILLWFALAGAAGLVERVTQRNDAPIAMYSEDAPDGAQEVPAHEVTEGNDYVQLRQQKPAVGGVTKRPGDVAGGNWRREASRNKSND